MKLLLKIIGVLVILLILVVIGVVFYIDSLAKRGVEYAATSALGVNTTVSTIHVGILGGSVSLDDLNVANPAGQGFTTDHFLTLKDGKVTVSLASLMHNTVVVPVLNLDGLDMNLEKKNGKSNYQMILDNLSAGEKSPPAKQPQAQGKTYVINELTITNIAVHVDLLPLGGALTKTSLVIPEIKLTNVGSETSGGVALSELSSVIVKAVMQAIISKSGDLPAELIGELGSGLGKLKSIDGALEVIGGASNILNKTIGDSAKDVNKVAEGLGGLLGGNKDKTKADDKASDDKKPNDVEKVTEGLSNLLGGKKKDNPADKPTDKDQDKK